MSAFPTVLTHNYHPDGAPFGNICDRPKPEAAALLSGWRAVRPSYLDRRLTVEAWLGAESRRLVGGVRLQRPRYLFLGHYADGRDPYRPSSIVVPLAALPPEALTFTYPDSMASWLLATRPELARQRRDHHGRVFTLAGIIDLVARIGLPERRWPREPGALSDGFVEAQLWDDAPVRALIDSCALDTTSARAGLG